MQFLKNVTTAVNISHLGVTIGNELRGRIIALPTSEVFYNQSLISSFLHIQPSDLDNGFQAHLYTCPSDTLVVYLPTIDDSILEQLFNCISVNADIWKTLTGLQLVTGDVVIAYSQQRLSSAQIPPGIELRQGTLMQVAIRLAEETGRAIVAFVFNEHFLQESGLSFPENNRIAEYAKTTSLLMHKNKTIELLNKNNVPVPVTSFSERKEQMVDKTRKYIFKPAGGAAGLGVYTNEGKGATWYELQNYIKMLRENHLLPTDYQIQEFIPGPVYGTLVLFRPGRMPEILQIHDQIINQKSKFTGGYWSHESQRSKYDIVEKLVEKIAAIREVQFIGLMGIDIIDGKVIEINPRITASSPVSHLLAKEKEIVDFLGPDFRIQRIDINTGVPVSREMIKSGRLKKNIIEMWAKHKVLILPQGLNPVGNSRFLFINDNSVNDVQKEFLKTVSD